MSNQIHPYEPLTSESAALVLVDHQVGLMTGHEKLMRNIVAASAALNLLCVLVLVPRFGATGAAAGTAFSLGVMKIVCWLMVRNTLGIDVLDYNALRKPAR